MDAIVKKPFSGRPDGQVYPRQFDAGETVTGELAEIAVKEGWAEKAKPSKPAKEAEGG